MTKLEYFQSLGPEGMKKLTEEQKRAALHKGPCSSPNAKEREICTCPRPCMLHGRCCDCIAHHMEERLDLVAKGVDVEHDYTWIPHCLQFFDARHGIGMEMDPNAGALPMRPPMAKKEEPEA